MSEHEDRREPTGGDESRRRFLRSERVWRRILRRADRSVTQFANFYEHFVRDTGGLSCGSDCLDNCARAMGWQLSGDEDEDDAENEAGNENSPLGGNADPAENAENSDENADSARGNDDADFSPEKSLPALPVYSLQNLPVSIAATAIYTFAREYWNRIWLGKLGEKLPAFAAAEVLEPLADAHRDLLLGIDAREASECGLAICLLKRALSALNVHFEAAAKILVPPDAVKKDEKYADARAAVRLAALDLRELCLRILRETREDAAGTSPRGND